MAVKGAADPAPVRQRRRKAASKRSNGPRVREIDRLSMTSGIRSDPLKAMMTSRCRLTGSSANWRKHSPPHWRSSTAALPPLRGSQRGDPSAASGRPAASGGNPTAQAREPWRAIPAAAAFGRHRLSAARHDLRQRVPGRIARQGMLRAVDGPACRRDGRSRVLWADVRTGQRCLLSAFAAGGCIAQPLPRASARIKVRPRRPVYY
jgi:hypothetical protein